MRTLSIIGRRWFQRTYGNTYHTAEIQVDGRTVHKTERAYGYGEQYRQSAMNWLLKQGLIDLRPAELLREWAERCGVVLSVLVLDVSRLRDL